MSAPWLIVGLGNPGPAYESTRHNIGQRVVDALCERLRVKRSKHPRAQALVARGHLRPGGPSLILATSTGYMNTSGGPVSQLTHYFDVAPDRLIVVHDELDIPFDTLKLKQGGGHGGHNGVRDIARALDTPEFVRVRVGIGRPPGRGDVAEFVLKPFNSVERETLPVLIEEAADAVELVVEQGLLAAQQRVHGGGAA